MAQQRTCPDRQQAVGATGCCNTNDPCSVTALQCWDPTCQHVVQSVGIFQQGLPRGGRCYRPHDPRLGSCCSCRLCLGCRCSCYCHCRSRRCRRFHDAGLGRRCHQRWGGPLLAHTHGPWVRKGPSCGALGAVVLTLVKVWGEGSGQWVEGGEESTYIPKSGWCELACA